MKQFKLARRALQDLREIWEFVSQDSFDAADRLLEEFYREFQRLAEMPERLRKLLPIMGDHCDLQEFGPYGGATHPRVAKAQVLIS
ncbi:MAG: type II toxin-antitoxin system RelE/ParE family toxin [Bryobacterales bacterium]|nr:type II toxin-antitoxin system RelE/ParE family toxin [Bryobacterales bacterium]